MNYQKWPTNGLSNDLMQTTSCFSLRDFENGYVLFGEQPPPPHRARDEYAEMQMLHLYGGCKPSDPENIGKPDLAGITQMLRMVDVFTEKREQETSEEKAKTVDVLSISKLNPNVQEFVPKQSNTLSTAEDSEPQKTGDCDNVRSLIDNRIDKTKLTHDEVKDIKEKLKSKINDTSKTACMKVKRARNLAIATLIQLHCKSPTSPNVENKLKLISPDYYEKSIEKLPVSTDGNKPNKEKIEGAPSNGGNKPIVGKIVGTLLTGGNKPAAEKFEGGPSIGGKKSEERSSIGIKTPTIEKIEIPIVNADVKANDVTDKEMAESVDKVQKWLCALDEKKNTTVKRNGVVQNGMNCNTTVNKTIPKDKVPKSSPHLGAIIFQRKATSKPMSPSSSNSVATNKVEKSMVFKPSAYASELAKTYMVRSQVIDTIEQDVWTRVEIEMKAKAEEIKERQRAEVNEQTCQQTDDQTFVSSDAQSIYQSIEKSSRQSSDQSSPQKSGSTGKPDELKVELEAWFL